MTNETYSLPAAEKATSGAKHLGSSPLGIAISVCVHRAPPSREMCSAQPNSGVSMRLDTARFAGRTGLRTSVGELWALMSPAVRAETFTGRSRPTRVTVGARS